MTDEESVKPSERTRLVKGAGSDEDPDHDGRTNFKFNIETLRMVAFSNLVILILTGAILTHFFVDVPVEETVIFKLFGFNHICNVIGHNPAREVCSLMVIFFILPMAAFILGSYWRTKNEAETNPNDVKKWLVKYTKVTTPINLLFMCYSYMWFVNPPDGDYGFLGHYLPYVGMQLSVGLIAIEQVAFLIATKSLPFGASKNLAKTYLVVLLVTTVLCQVGVFSQMAGRPLFDSVNDPVQRVLFQLLMYWYSFLAVIMQIVFGYVNRKNGNLTKITIE